MPPQFAAPTAVTVSVSLAPVSVIWTTIEAPVIVWVEPFAQVEQKVVASITSE